VSNYWTPRHGQGNNPGVEGGNHGLTVWIAGIPGQRGHSDKVAEVHAGRLSPTREAVPFSSRSVDGSDPRSRRGGWR